MRVVNTEKAPIKLWLDDIEEGAMQRAREQILKELIKIKRENK